MRNKRPIKTIAHELGRSLATIYNEVKRGTVEQVDSLLKPYMVYCADVGQRIQDERAHNKGVNLKIGNDYITARFIVEQVKKYKKAPYAVSLALRADTRFTSLSDWTIYQYIHKGVFYDLDDNNLFYKVKKKSKDTDEEKRKHSYRFQGAKTIEQRPKDIYKRDCYGHWEMDTVYSGKDTSRACLLVLTERMTRQERIYKMNDRTAQSVLDTLNAVERDIGYQSFSDTFKTLTVDNGGEFAYFDDIEKSCTENNKRRTELYFCHAYASCERGSNENANKLIRKFIPKSADIGAYTDDYIRFMQDCINDYPRRLFGGMSSNEYLKTIDSS